MAKLGEFKAEDFFKFRDNVEKALKDNVIDAWMEEILLELAFRAERKIKKRTPVNKDPKVIGGHLRRNWKVGSVTKKGASYSVEIYNNVEYASYVEYGHRTRDHKKWIEGRFMATISLEEVERESVKFIERKQAELLNKILGGK
ncbi:MAG: HK97 gp10 family phage protein [Clostridium sp.]